MREINQAIAMVSRVGKVASYISPDQEKPSTATPTFGILKVSILS